jgi:molybdate transport system ATP-binding protein
MSLSLSVRAKLSSTFTLDVTMEAPPGITIVFGASGSGKSTLLRSVAGLVRPEAGSISIASRILFDAASRLSLPVRQRRVGYVFQQLALFPHMSVGNNLAYGLHDRPAQVRREQIGAIAESFRIQHVLARRPDAISGGERQRTALARSLVTRPDVLLLDEPLSALDHATQSRIIDDLRAWNTAHGIPILYVTHAHREVFALGDRVVVLDHGRIVATGIPHDVLDLPEHEGVARIAGFENVFDAVVTDRRPGAGTMQCALTGSGTELEVPLSRGERGTAVRVAVRAGDILLATEPPRGLSARNVIHGRIVSLVREGPTIVARVDAGAPFVVHVTPTAVDALSLTPGRPVWLIVKTYSCRIVSHQSDSSRY